MWGDTLRGVGVSPSRRLVFTSLLRLAILFGYCIAGRGDLRAQVNPSRVPRGASTVPHALDVQPCHELPFPTFQIFDHE